MTEKRAESVLIAYACCNTCMCDYCPWKNTEDCANTSFSGIIDEAIMILEKKWKGQTYGNRNNHEQCCS
jgi:hypothetical protein